MFKVLRTSDKSPVICTDKKNDQNWASIQGSAHLQKQGDLISPTENIREK
jgi:hypothetical protein